MNLLTRLDLTIVIFRRRAISFSRAIGFVTDEPVEPPLTPDAMPASVSGKSTGGGAASAPEPPHGVELPDSYQPRKCRRCGCLA